MQIQKAGLSAAGLTRQLLAFSRKEIISPTLLDLNVVLASMRVMLRRLIREDVKIELTLRPELALVMADRGQIEQIVLNLAVNARDAMPKGGTLKIEIATVELDDRMRRPRGVRPAPTWRSRSPIRERACHRRCRRACLNPSSPPRSPAEARDSAWRPFTGS